MPGRPRVAYVPRRCSFSLHASVVFGFRFAGHTHTGAGQGTNIEGARGLARGLTLGRDLAALADSHAEAELPRCVALHRRVRRQIEQYEHFDEVAAVWLEHMHRGDGYCAWPTLPGEPVDA